MKTKSKFLLIIVAMFFVTPLFSQTYNKAVVAADKMNVLYIGIDNPVSVAVPGITNEKLKVTITKGSISGSNGKYIVKVDEPGETKIEMIALDNPGKFGKVGGEIFRVKRIPDPTPCLGNLCNTRLFITKDELIANQQINVELNLPFELKFEVISFNLSYKSGEEWIIESTKDNKFSPQMIDIINKMEAGSKLLIEDIKAKGPDDQIRTLNSISIELL